MNAGSVMDELKTLVRAAQSGDKEAFGSIVTRFQDMAYAVAYAMSGDPVEAQDAAQEAFIEAFLRLQQLREPAAFPGWFRRIVIKYSDRQVRRQPKSVTPFTDALQRTTSKTDPAAIVENEQIRSAIHDSIAALPHNQRLATMLYYVQGYSINEVADSLDTTVGAVKKNLYSARKRLKQRMLIMIQDELQSNKPSQDEAFANKVRFFLALKTGDLNQVKILVGKDPDLIRARTEWGVASEGYYWPLGYNAIHWAAGIGDVELLKYLLAEGADINSRTKSGSTPLHIAILMRRPEIAALLISWKADTNAQNAQGFTPLHIAVLRNIQEMVQLLLQNSADASIPDAKGRKPADWAVLKNEGGILQIFQEQGVPIPESFQIQTRQGDGSGRNVRRVPVGERLLGRVIDENGKPIDGLPAPKGAPVEPVPQASTLFAEPLLETGIKIVDLFAPIKRGGSAGVFTPLPGVGKFVLLAQLIQNFTEIYSGYAVCIGLEEAAYTAESLMLAWRDWGIDQRCVNVFGKIEQPPSGRIQAAETGLAIAENFRNQGNEVLLLVDANLGLSEGVMDYLRTNASSTSRARITTLVYGDQSVGALPEPLDRLDSAVTFDRDRASRGLWPAVDPLRSYSERFHTETVLPVHRSVAEQARRMLQRYRDIRSILEKGGLDALPSPEDKIVAIRAPRLEQFLTQPFTGAEPWTGIPGEVVRLDQTIRGCQEILAGKTDDLPEDVLYFIGSIDGLRK